MTETAEREVLYKPHSGPQTEFHERNEDVVLFGGSKGPGKTQALLFESLRQIEKPGYKALILRRTFPRLQEMMDRAKAAFIRLGGKWEEKSHRFVFPSGASVAFGHCEHEDSKYNYQGHEYQFIGFDQLEEFTETQWRFLLAQCRTSSPDIECYVRATANPGGVGHWWIKRMFIDGRTSRKRYEEEFGEVGGIRLIRTSAYVPATISDNPSIMEANPQYVAYLRSLPEQERKAFLEGDWNAYNTGGIFDANGMLAQESLIREPSWVGELRDGARGPEFVLDEKGYLCIWKQPAPHVRYYITADVAKGVEGGDNSVAHVFDRSTREVVAEWCGRVDPVEFGKVLYGLGLYYGTAKIAPEVWPGPGGVSGAKLVDMGYPKHCLYRRLVWNGEKHDTSAEVGWVTDQRGRYDLISALQEAVRAKDIIVRSRAALDEMKNFTRNPQGRFEARSGCHDDRVITLGIACFVMNHDPVSEMLGDDKGNDSSMVVGQVVRLPGRKETVLHGPRWRNFRGQ